MKVTILTEKDIRRCVQVDEDALDIVAEGFTKLAL